MSWGLNIDALKRYTVVPTTLCENTTFQHYACTISHMLLIYKAYMANEVRRARHTSVSTGGGPALCQPTVQCRLPAALADAFIMSGEPAGPVRALGWRL